MSVRRAVSLRAAVYEAAERLAVLDERSVSEVVERLIRAEARERGVTMPSEEGARARLREQRTRERLAEHAEAMERAREVRW